MRDVKRHLISQGVYGGGKRPLGFDVVNHRLVPNANEQAAVARMQALRANGRPLREISRVLASELHVEMAATSVKRILRAAAP
jgi:putative DNA-invertase from lambdoid prophage Rac